MRLLTRDEFNKAIEIILHHKDVLPYFQINQDTSMSQIKILNNKILPYKTDGIKFFGQEISGMSHHEGEEKHISIHFKTFIFRDIFLKSDFELSTKQIKVWSVLVLDKAGEWEIKAYEISTI